MAELKQPSDNNFTLRQIAGHPSLLESLAVDEVYSIHDEFNYGLTNLWGTAKTIEGAQEFIWDREARQGGLYGNTGPDDDASIRLFSRLDTWSPAKRCSAQMRFSIAELSTVKFEFGFVSSYYPLDDPSQSDGAVLVKATPTATLPDFRVVCYDTDDDTNLTAVCATRNAAVSAADQSSSESTLTEGDHSLQIHANEHGSVAFWLDGRFYGTANSPPLDISSSGTSGLTGPLDSSSKSESGSHLWVYVQNRAGALPHSFTIDYIKAWQERTARDF